MIKSTYILLLLSAIALEERTKYLHEFTREVFKTYMYQLPLYNNAWTIAFNVNHLLCSLRELKRGHYIYIPMKFLLKHFMDYWTHYFKRQTVSHVNWRVNRVLR